MREIGEFVNFAVVNFHFMAAQYKRKLVPGSKNCLFSSPTPHLGTQTKRCFQCRMRRWQITIFDFLTAQLDFLAKLSSLPYSRAKIANLRHSSAINNLSKYYNIFDK